MKAAYREAEDTVRPVIRYTSKSFFAALLPIAYSDSNGENAGQKLQEELLPILTALSEEEENTNPTAEAVWTNAAEAESASGVDAENETESGAASEKVAESETASGKVAVSDGTSEYDAVSDASSENAEEADDLVEVIGPAASLAVSYTGTTYTREQICDYDFLVNQIFTIDKSASVTREELDGATLLDRDMTIDLSGEDYKVLIYHTHGSETFADSREGVTEDTVIGVGDRLAELLEQYGIKTYHDRTVYDMQNGKLDRNNAYTLASAGVDRILEEYPSIEVVIDLHRDGVSDDVHLVTEIDGRPTAKIMFFNGISRSKKNGDLTNLYNPYKIDNLAFSLQMFLEGKKISDDLVRKIYIKMYRFNLDKRPRATLIEVGAQTNTVEEEMNAMIPLAAILYSVLNQE